MEARAGIEPAIEVLQTSALPLGYRAAEKSEKSVIFGKGQRETAIISWKFGKWLDRERTNWFIQNMKRIGIIQAKTQFSDLCREVNEKHRLFLIEKRGQPLAMLTPVPKELLTDQRDILTALEEWEAVMGPDESGTDFPEVWKQRTAGHPPSALDWSS